MKPMILAGALAMTLVAVPALAQPDHRVEVSVNGGYTASEGVPVNSQSVIGQLVDEVSPKSGGS